MPGAFITETELSNQLGRDLSGDLAVSLILEAACDTCRDVAEQQFDRVIGGTAVLDGTGTDALLLPHLPVTQAGTVLVNGGTITDYVLNGNGMLFRGTAGAYPRPIWPAGRQNVSVTYDYGYTTVTIPRSVKMVALAIATRLAVQGPAKQETVGDASMTYAVAATDLTPGELRILKKYRQSR